MKRPKLNPSCDPSLLRVHENLLASVAESMGVALERTGFSPNIRERRDYSCGVFDGDGQLVTHAAHIPVHLGSTPLAVEEVLRTCSAAGRSSIEPGEVWILNDPYRGGTHLPDWTAVEGVFEADHGRPTFIVANRAHHADVGGSVPGSMGLTSEIFQEGIRIPPVRWFHNGQVDDEIESLILANVRQPAERRGDLAAQRAALAVGVQQLSQFLQTPRRDEIIAYTRHLLDAGERCVRAVFEAIPNGTYAGEDVIESDGFGDAPIPIHVDIHIDGDRATFDFSSSGPQSRGSLNANRAITTSAVLYVLSVASDGELPANAGSLRPVQIVTKSGTICDPVPPAAVAGGNVETSQRLVDVLFDALSKAMPERMPAQSQGTMNNWTMGGDRGPRGSFSYYETLAGGAGATPEFAGGSAVHTHMTNTRNTPIEALEHDTPVRVIEYSVRHGSGGQGKFAGGDGIVRELEFLEPVTLSLLTERRQTSPKGANGGFPGASGRNLLNADGKSRELPGKWSGTVEAGGRLRIETPGGGGWGEPDCDAQRDTQRNTPDRDFLNGRHAESDASSAADADRNEASERR